MVRNYKRRTEQKKWSIEDRVRRGEMDRGVRWTPGALCNLSVFSDAHLTPINVQDGQPTLAKRLPRMAGKQTTGRGVASESLATLHVNKFRLLNDLTKYVKRLRTF